jgi:hypothetical protein
MRKDEMSATTYFTKMTDFADKMAAAGKLVNGNDLASFILVDLDAKYKPLVEGINRRVDPITLHVLYAKLLDSEARIECPAQCHQISANMSAHGRGRDHPRSHDEGSGHPGGRIHSGDRGGTQSADRPQCQIYLKYGHQVVKCWKCFDRNFINEERRLLRLLQQAMMLTHPGILTWVCHGPHHIGDLDRLIMKEMLI